MTQKKKQVLQGTIVVLSLTALGCIIDEVYWKAHVQLDRYRAVINEITADNQRLSSEKDTLRQQLADRQKEAISKRFELVFGFGLPVNRKEVPGIVESAAEVVLSLEADIGNAREELADYEGENKDPDPGELSKLSAEIAQAKARYDNARGIYKEAKDAGLFFNKSKK